MQYHFPDFQDIIVSNSAMYPDQATHTLAALEYQFVPELTKYSRASVSSRLGLTSTISTNSTFKRYSGYIKPYNAVRVAHRNFHVSEHLVYRASKHF